jgi:hypothetical protein
VDLGDDGGALAHRRRDALGRAGADVADREHPGEARLEGQGGTAGRARASFGQAKPVTTKPLESTATRSWSHPALGSAPMNKKRWRNGQV